MLLYRIAKLIGVGLCLLAINRFLNLTYACARGADRLMMRPFFDVEGLTEEIRRMAAQRQRVPAPERAGSENPLAAIPAYRWLCNRLRRACGLEPLRVPPPDAKR